MRHAFRTFVLVAPLAASAFAQEGEKVPLTLHLTKGATAEFEQTSITSQTMTREGAPMQNSVEAHRALTVTVASVAADGGGTIDVKFGRIHGSAASPMGTFEFDTEKAADPADPTAQFTAPFSKPLTVLSGKTVTASVAKDGKVSDVKGSEALAEEAAAGNPMAKRMAQQFLSATAVRGYVTWVFTKMPEKPVGVGDTWTDQITQDPQDGVKMTVDLTFKVTAMDADAVSVSVDGKVSIVPVDVPGATPGADGGKPGGEKAGDKGGGAPGGAGGFGVGGPGGAGAPGGAGGAGRGGRGGPGGTGGGFMKDANVEKGVISGTAKVSRKDGMTISSETEMLLVLKGKDGTPAAGTSVEQTQTSKMVRKAAAAKPM